MLYPRQLNQVSESHYSLTCYEVVEQIPILIDQNKNIFQKLLI